ALPPLARGRARAWADELARGFVLWGWLALLVGPPLFVWTRRRRETATAVPGTAPPAVPARLTRLGQLEREFHAVLASHVPDQPARDGDGLARALRAAGVESAVADHVKRLRRRRRQGDGSLDEGRPPRAAGPAGATGARTAPATRCGERGAADHGPGHAWGMGARGGALLGRCVERRGRATPPHGRLRAVARH